MLQVVWYLLQASLTAISPPDSDKVREVRRPHDTNNASLPVCTGSFHRENLQAKLCEMKKWSCISAFVISGVHREIAAQVRWRLSDKAVTAGYGKKKDRRPFDTAGGVFPLGFWADVCFCDWQRWRLDGGGCVSLPGPTWYAAGSWGAERQDGGGGRLSLLI